MRVGALWQLPLDVGDLSGFSMAIKETHIEQWRPGTQIESIISQADYHI